MRAHERNSSADSQGSGERGAGAAPSAEVPPQPVGKAVVKTLCPCSPGRSPGRSRVMPERGLSTCGKTVPEQALGGELQTHGERIPCWSRFPGRTRGPMRDLLWSRPYLKGCALRKGDSTLQRTVTVRWTTAGEIHGELFPLGGTPVWPLANVYKHLQGGCGEDKARFFPVVPSDRTIENGHTRKHRRLLLSNSVEMDKNIQASFFLV